MLCSIMSKKLLLLQQTIIIQLTDIIVWDNCDENTFKHTLELLEYVTIEAIGMGDCPIYLLTLLIEHSIGEIVILIDNGIKAIICKRFLSFSSKISY